MINGVCVCVCFDVALGCIFNGLKCGAKYEIVGTGSEVMCLGLDIALIMLSRNVAAAEVWETFRPACFVKSRIGCGGWKKSRMHLATTGAADKRGLCGQYHI